MTIETILMELNKLAQEVVGGVTTDRLAEIDKEMRKYQLLIRLADTEISGQTNQIRQQRLEFEKAQLAAQSTNELPTIPV